MAQQISWLVESINNWHVEPAQFGPESELIYPAEVS